MGLVTVGARLGGILAPFIVMLGDQHENLQFTVFGMLSLAAGDSHASRWIMVHGQWQWLWCNYNWVEYIQDLQTCDYQRLWEDLCQTPWLT